MSLHCLPKIVSMSVVVDGKFLHAILLEGIIWKEPTARLAKQKWKLG